MAGKALEAETALVESISRRESKQSHTAAEELVRSFTGDGHDDEQPKKCLCFMVSGNVRVLWLTAFLFALITGVQYIFGAVIIHSAALTEDCYCMGVDALSYFLNIGAEVAPAHMKRKLQLIIPCISLSVLMALTIYQALGAIDTIKDNPPAPEDPTAEDRKMAWIVWCFGFGGVVFDLISIYAFCKNKREKKEGQLPVNMLAAFMHVGADFIRSITTTIEGFFLIANFPPGINGDVVDAYSCMVITVIVVAAILYGLIEVVRDILHYCKTGE
jgi:Co/Zn/Cd efflux system component